MEAICIKLDDRIMKNMDTTIKENYYSTRSDFIREAIRDKLKELEKERAIKKLAAFKGSFKSKKSDKEIGEIAIRKIAKKLNVSLD